MMSENTISRRDPKVVMRLSRLGSFHQCRLSFIRTLMRRMAAEKWTFNRAQFDIDEHGVGTAVYTAKGPDRSYSLVAFAHDLPAEKRSDRVIADAWDATFALHDGVPSDADIQRLRNNVPYQEAGRINQTELTLSRANRSVRLWSTVIDALAAGKQPNLTELMKVGYLMRTTAVYGSGKFGAADRDVIKDRTEMQAPFQAEMLTVYLIRTFVRDLVQHMAESKGGAETATLDPEISQALGIGNSTGLGMAPFIVNHPILFNNWIMAREEAISRVRKQVTATEQEIETFQHLLARSELSISRWQSDHPIQIEKLTHLRDDIQRLKRHLAETLSIPEYLSQYPWNRLVLWSESELSEEGQEFVASLILEPYAHLVDGLSCCMSDANEGALNIDGSHTISQIKTYIQDSFAWAIDMDWSAKEHCARLWYVSAEKLEPRLGERFDEPLEDYEQPLAPARDAALAYRDLCDWDEKSTVAEFLLHHPEHRHTVRRAQLVPIAPYGEIRDNTISDSLLAIDMLRAKLSFFGATSFDPRSDRWVRICMFAGAPYPEQLDSRNADLWVYPSINQT